MSVLERPFFNFSVIKAPLQVVLEAFDTYEPMRVHSSKTPFVLPEQPYADENAKAPLILWTPKAAPTLTAFMPHVSSGDYYVGSYAVERFGLSLVAVRCSPPNDENAINEFAWYENKQLRRFVRAMKDSPRWTFYERGEVLAFEHTDKYKSKLIRQRLTREMVLQYVTALGAPVFDTGFWLTDMPSYTFVQKGKHVG